MKVVLTAMLGAVLLFNTTALAEDTATPEEIYGMVLKGAQVLVALGESGLSEFNDPNGQFAWKDTYVQVYNCKAKQIVGHINPALLTWPPEKFDAVQDKRGKYITREICSVAKKPAGGWVEYWWPKAGETEPSRKITFVIKVPGKPYEVSAGIYDDKESLQRLNRMVE